MKTSIQWLDAAKTVLRIDSDRGLDTHFGWKQQSSYDIKRNKRSLNNTEAAQIAEVLRVNPLVIIADAETERAKDEQTRLYWSLAAKKFAGIAASAMLVSAMVIPDSHASSLSTTATASPPIFYIMLNRLRRFLRAQVGNFLQTYGSVPAFGMP